MKGWEDVHIGTSGWHYDHWLGPFYPQPLAKKKEDLLAYYAEHFHTVEINNSFYQLPQKKTLETWRDTVPSGFLFAVKGSRYITHMKKLKDAQGPLSTFLKRVEVLQDKLGPILFQLPPQWKFNPERFYDFLETLPGEHTYAFEFRNRDWHNDETYDALRMMGASFCIYELDGYLSPKAITSNVVYIRLHGPGSAYEGRYDRTTLGGWAGSFSTWTDQGLEIFCYFDNDQAGYAARNALELQEMVERGR